MRRRPHHHARLGAQLRGRRRGQAVQPQLGDAEVEDLDPLAALRLAIALRAD